MNLYFVSIFLLSNVMSFSFAQVLGRRGTSCGYLSQKIYCFGGSASLEEDPISDSNLMYLDIIYYSGNSTVELATKWITITSKTNGINIQPRDSPQSIVLPDGKTMILSGGWNSDTSLLTAQTLAYNAENNSWSAYPGYTESPFGIRQIYYASSVYIPEYGVGFYGGLETNINQNWTYQGQNMSEYEFGANYSRQIGYTSLTFFDIRKTVDPWFVFPTQNNLPVVFSDGQTSVFDALSNRIFFFGGSYINSTEAISVSYSFKTSVTFDVITGTWGLQNLTGDFPSERVLHTTTLLTSTNRDVLLYGGESSSNINRPSLDYLFTLNLDSYKWKQQYISNSDALDVVRSQHSAVPVYNNTVLIIFGINVSGVPVSSMIILNVIDPANVSSFSTYVDPNGVHPSINGTEPPNINEVENPGGNPGLSKGAKIGIAVGIVAGGLIIVTIIFYVWKKIKDKKKKKEFEEIDRQNERIEEPVMEVNWEVIDQNYEKFAANPTSDFTRPGDPTTMTEYISELCTSPMLVHQSLELQRPNTIESDVKGLSVALEKPDGGH